MEIPYIPYVKKYTKRVKSKMPAGSRNKRFLQLYRRFDHLRIWGCYMSLEQYEHMLISQGGRCSICGIQFSPEERDCIDHDHATGAARGLLCQKCNAGLGNFSDSQANLLNAAAYLGGQQDMDEGAGI